MSLTVAGVMRRVRRLLFDQTAVRWSNAELLDYLNDAQRAIVQYRPEAYAVSTVVSRTAGTLSAGTRQVLPAGGIRLLRVIRNALVPTGGRAIREVNRLALDAENPGWHGMAGTSEITHFAFDQINPRTYYVYPPASAASAAVEIVYSAMPPVLTWSGSEGDPGSPIGVGSHYVNQLVDWVAYRALSKDATFAGDAARAAHYLVSFANGLDTTMNAEQAAAFPRGNTASTFNARGEVA